MKFSTALLKRYNSRENPYGIEFIDELSDSSKGILFDDGKFRIWKTDDRGFPAHDYALDKTYFTNGNPRSSKIIATFTRWQGKLSIESLKVFPWSPEIAQVVYKYMQSGGNDIMHIYGKDNTTFSGDPIEYRKYLAQKRNAQRQQQSQYKLAGPTVSGLLVRQAVPNFSSIEASFSNPIIFGGIREVPMSFFTLDESPLATDEQTRQLADEIEKSGEINPLIVGIDPLGPYIVEGAHRYDALKLLGVKSFPAVIVYDEEDESQLRISQKNVEFHTMLHRGYKGILFNDNTWVTWDSWHTPAFSFEATHKAVHDKYFPNKEILVTAYHAPDSTLYINSGALNIWDSNVEMVVNKFVGNRGSGSKLIIERSIGGHNHFEGTFREYLEDNPKLRISQKNIEFIDGLPQGSKGILLTDGKWIAWQADYSGFPHHQHVLAEVLHKKFDSVLLSADHSHDDLYIESLTYEPWSSEVTWIVSKYFQSGGNGHIDIFGKSQEFSGDSIEYRRYLTKKRKDL